LTLTRDLIEARQKKRLAELLRLVASQNPFYRAKIPASALIAVEDESRTLPAILQEIPFTKRQELEDDQKKHPPFGSRLTYEPARYSRWHQTSGTNGTPLRWLDTPESWVWWCDCWTVVYQGMELSPQDRLFFPFSFGPFVGFWSAFDSAARLGNLCVPGGGMTTAARLELLKTVEATVVVATPTYALRMLEVAHADGIDLSDSSVRALIVAGEPGGSIPEVRMRLESGWGARVFDHCGMTEVGAFGFESTRQPGGLYVNEEAFIVEALDPETGSAARPGEMGELVMTNLGRLGSPVIRYRTGDVVRWNPENTLAESGYGCLEGGILSRSDDMISVRGNNVYPGAMEALMRRLGDVAEYRVIVAEGNSLTSLEVEVEPTADVPDQAGVAERVAGAIERTFLFRAQVRVVAPGTLPRFDMKARRFVMKTSAGYGGPSHANT
jgi:phenylacetate-CoA ligase